MTFPQLKRSVIYQTTISGTYLLIDLDDPKETVYNVNRTAGFFLEGVLSGKTAEETLSGVCSAFEVDTHTAAKDLADFIEFLREKNLIVPEG